MVVVWMDVGTACRLAERGVGDYVCVWWWDLVSCPYVLAAEIWWSPQAHGSRRRQAVGSHVCMGQQLLPRYSPILLPGCYCGCSCSGGVFVVVVAVVAVVVLQASHIRVSCRTLDSPSLGNEYWIGRLGASGDPAAACCSLIPQLQDPHVNPTLRGCNTVCVFG